MSLRLPDIVGDEKHAHAAPRACIDDPLDREDRGGVEARRRLVEQQHFGVGGKRAGEREALRLAAREQPGRLTGLVGETRRGRKQRVAPAARRPRARRTKSRLAATERRSSTGFWNTSA